MKVEHLMVGDWVKNEGVVTQLKNQDFIGDRKSFTPIDLTEEILLKIGFKKTKLLKNDNKNYDYRNNRNFDYYCLGKSQYRLYDVYISITKEDVFSIHAEVFYYADPNKTGLSRVFTGDILWVHELQHIFRMLNIEKEVII